MNFIFLFVSIHVPGFETHPFQPEQQTEGLNLGTRIQSEVAFIPASSGKPDWVQAFRRLCFLATTEAAFAC